MKTLVLGAGAFGTALGQILTENGHKIKYYDPVLGVSLKDCLDDVEILVLVAPSFALSDLLPKLPHDLPMIVATKGILDTRIFEEFTDVMALSGPAFADELKAHQPSTLTATDERVKELFGTDYLSFDYTADIKGVFLCGALKNVYALLAGLRKLERDTPDYEKNLAVFAEEMKALLSANGAEARTVELACGIGDLRLTCGLPSRNYEFGTILADNPQAKPEKTVEGLSALRKIAEGAIKVPDSAINMKELIERSKEWA